MRKLPLKILPIAACSLLVVAGTASGAPQQARTASSVKVVMRDPGCHWFAVGGAFKTKLAVKGPAALRNLDEATLKIVGHGKVTRARVGRTVTLTHGSYRITMIGQKSDDNTLRLVVH
jgi:hypothetical protein